MPPVPKRRHSSGRKGKRRSALKIKNMPATTRCPYCGALKPSHQTCPVCGR